MSFKAYVRISIIGAVGGGLIDLIYITLAGPSAIFNLILGITNRYMLFGAHVVLGGAMGMLFLVLLHSLKLKPSWFAGIFWGLLCLGIIGGIPALITNTITPITTFFGFFVWILYGLILVAGMKVAK